MVSSMIDDLKITVPVAPAPWTMEHMKLAYDCIDAGFSSIMFDGSHYPIEENIEKTKELVKDLQREGSFYLKQRLALSAGKKMAL